MRIAAVMVAAAVLSTGCIRWEEELAAYCADGGGGCPDAGPGGGGDDAGTSTAALTVFDGSGQQSPAGLLFDATLVVQAIDADGNAAATVQVTAACPATPPTCHFEGAQTATAETDSDGYAYLPPVTAGVDPGTYQLTVTAAGFDPTSFTLTNGDVDPYQIIAPDPASTDLVATVGDAFPSELVFQVVGSDGLPFSGALVQFLTPSDGATAIFASSSTNVHEVVTGSAGEASTGQLRAGTVAGAFPLYATVVGEDGAELFWTSVTLEVRPGPPHAIDVVSGNMQTVATGGTLVAPLVARVVDSYANAVGEGVTVEFVNGGSGQRCLFSSADTTTETVTTAADGTVETGCTTSDVEGTFNVTVRLPDTAISTTFAITSVLPQMISIAGGSPQTVTQSGVFEGLAVLVQANSQPVPGATITFTAPAADPTATFADTGTRSATAISDENGVATSAQVTPGAVGTFQVAATEPHLDGVVLYFDLQTTAD